MALLEHAKNWIENSWREGRDIPVGQYALFDVDDMGFPFRHKPLQAWRLVEGRLLPDSQLKLEGVPHIAFSLDEPSSKMHINVLWAPRCGYGCVIGFDSGGEVVNQETRWIS